jgi:hypothetical protein
MIYKQFISLFEKDTATPPIIIDENSCLEILSTITGKHLTDLDECRTSDISTISLYEIQEDKKLFDITTVRHCIRDISLIPYEWKHIYILRWIDKWTPEAMNALLKVLEECPIYASIMLVVEDPEALLETIHSRSMNLYRDSTSGTLTAELQGYFDEYLRWDVANFTRELFYGKLDKSEAIWLLRHAIMYWPAHSVEIFEQWIIDIRNSHESPRNILDSIFFIPR